MNSLPKPSLIGAIAFLTSITKNGTPDYNCGDYVIVNESEDGRILQGLNLARGRDHDAGDFKTFLLGGAPEQWHLNGTRYDDARVVRHAICLENWSKEGGKPGKQYIDSVYQRAKAAADKLREIVKARKPKKLIKNKAKKIVAIDIETGGLKDPNPTFILSSVKVAPKPAQPAQPTRDARGRFASKEPKKNIVARFYYRKDDQVLYYPRVVTIAKPIVEGASDRFGAFDLGRQGHRTFRFSNVKGGFKGITFTREVIK